MRVRINEALTLARLPAALWTDIHGGRWPFENPGASVMSFCVFNLSCEFAEVPEELEETIQQCRDFSTKREHITVVLEYLGVKAASMAHDVNNNPSHDHQKQVFHEMSEMMRLSQEVERIRGMFEVNGTMPPRLDASSQVFPTFIQVILDLKWAIDRLGDALKRAELPPTKA